MDGEALDQQRKMWELQVTPHEYLKYADTDSSD